MLQTPANPEGLPMEVFDNLRKGITLDRSQFYKDLATPFYGANRPGAKVSQGMLDQFWLWSMQAGLKNAYKSIEAFSETDFTEDLKKIDVPTLIIHGEDDQIVPVKNSARKTASASTITVQKLRGNVSVLMGAGGNIVVLPGRDGKLLIDSGFAGARPKITDALASISSDPIKHLINTHWHFDHTDGNEWLHTAGAAILAHANTRKHLSTTTRVEGWNFTFPPSPAGAIPTEAFEDQWTVQLNGTTIALKHYAPAHTDSDISVHFTDADILHVADTFWNGYYPFIDYSTGGSIDGMIRATETNLAKVTDKMIVIPGHGAVANKSLLVFYRDLLVATRDKVAPLKNQGNAPAEIIAPTPTAVTDAEWGNGFRSPKDFIGDVFRGV